MGLAGSGSNHGERELNGGVRGEGVDAAVGHELSCSEGAAHDLEEDGHAGRGVGSIVDEEVGAVEVEVEVDRDVDTAGNSLTGRGEVLEGDEVGLGEDSRAGALGGRGLNLGGAVVAEDGRVDAAIEGERADVGEGADPVVVDGLVGGEDERVALACVDLDLVNGEGLVVDRVDLDDRHVVAVDRERVVGVARERGETEAVTLALGDSDNGELGGGTLRGRRAAKTVDERRIRTNAEEDRLVYGGTY